jgi:transcriptional regulator with XRE-family HTH domain
MSRMRDLHVGRAIRTMRVRRRWRQQDLAMRAGISRSTVSRAECGDVDALTIATLRRICDPLEIVVDLRARGRGADLDRAVNARHSALHESVARSLLRWSPGWEMAHEVSFNVYGERGVIDLVLWHPGRRALLIIELKTELIDEGDLLATTDRRRRLAREIVAERRWRPQTVSTWVIVARSRTTERRLAAHRTVLRSAFPSGERQIRALLRDPVGAVNALSLWAAPASAPRIAPTCRVRRPDLG